MNLYDIVIIFIYCMKLPDQHYTADSIGNYIILFRCSMQTRVHIAGTLISIQFV